MKTVNQFAMQLQKKQYSRVFGGMSTICTARDLDRPHRPWNGRGNARRRVQGAEALQEPGIHAASSSGFAQLDEIRTSQMAAIP